MYIKKIKITNFKIFKEFSLELNQGINILVGNNGEGKSTILEAINLVLSGVIYGKYLKNELSQYLFNNEVIEEYLMSLETGEKKDLPSIIIELFLDGNNPELEILNGNSNSDSSFEKGIKFEIKFDDAYKEEYEALLLSGERLVTLPIEYYKLEWQSFARATVTLRSIPVKSVLIDSSSFRYQNGSDIYISRIIKNNLENDQKLKIAQTYRKIKEKFMEEDCINEINHTLDEKIGNKNLEISIDLSSQNSWESMLMTYLGKIPFQQIGKGDQSIIKTRLALKHDKTNEAQILLIEEPENHLSHTKLNELLNDIVKNVPDKQVIISTHSSFVSNKLGINNLILLNANTSIKLLDLDKETYDFFKKLPGYNTLRFILCKRVVLVEGPSDELIFQKAYLKRCSILPIEDGIDVISCGLTFKRFLDIALKLNIKVAVLTDNDGNYEENIDKKYGEYMDAPNILICASNDDTLNTLEPQFVEVNDVELLKSIFRSRSIFDKSSLISYLIKHKTDWALKIFELDGRNSYKINYPDYFEEAISWCLN